MQIQHKLLNRIYIHIYLYSYLQQERQEDERILSWNKFLQTGKNNNSIYWHHSLINVWHIKYLSFFVFHINAKLYFIQNLDIMQTKKKTSIVRNIYIRWQCTRAQLIMISQVGNCPKHTNWLPHKMTHKWLNDLTFCSISWFFSIQSYVLM